MLNFIQYLSEQEHITKEELDEIEKVIDKIFKVLNIDIVFTKHFLDQLNNSRNNNRPITRSELIQLFTKEKNINGKEISNMDRGRNAILQDINTNINIPFVLEWNKDKKMLDLVTKTIIRKKKFLTTNSLKFVV